MLLTALIVADTSENGSFFVTGSVMFRGIVETCIVAFTLESMVGVGVASSFPGSKDEMLKAAVGVPFSVVEGELSIASVELLSETEFVVVKLLFDDRDAGTLLFPGRISCVTPVVCSLASSDCSGRVVHVLVIFASTPVELGDELAVAVTNGDCVSF